MDRAATNVAAFFEKRHDHVLRDIRELIRKEPSLAPARFGAFKINDLTGENTSHSLGLLNFEEALSGGPRRGLGETVYSRRRFCACYFRSSPATSLAASDSRLRLRVDPLVDFFPLRSVKRVFSRA
jgi:hypothetical protein